MANPVQPRLFAPADAIAPEAVERVLVVMLRHHGDVLLTTPVITALKRALPNVQVDALIYRDTLPMLQFNGALTKVHTIDRAWKRQGALAQLGHEWRLIRTLRARKYDLVIHLTNHRRGAWMVRLLGPRYAVAPKLRDQDRFWKSSFTHLYPSALSVHAGHPLANRHTVEQHLDALRRLGIEVARPPSLSLTAGTEGEAAASASLTNQGIGSDTEYVLVQPTSRWMFKTWPVAHNVALIRGLLARGLVVVVSCGPDPREQQVAGAIVAGLGVDAARVRFIIDPDTLNRLAALIARARLFVGVDSAPMHIAAAARTPLVALFGPSGEDNWGPWRGDGDLVFEVLTSAHRCRPCGQDGCGGGKVSECLTAISPERVLSSVDDVLRRSEPLYLA